MNKTTRNPCLCKADVLEGSTQNNMSSVSWTPCSAITYPQPTLVHTCPRNPGVLNPYQHWAPTKYLPPRVRFRRSQIHAGISAKKKKKQICKTPQVILMYIKGWKTTRLSHIVPTSPYKIHFLKPMFILVIFYLMDYILSYGLHS